MSARSSIEWTGATWGPTIGCSKVSDGCRNCYAILQVWMKMHHPNPKISAAFEGLVEQRPDGSLNWTGRVNALPERLELPLHWREPRRIFVDSLSDLFHPNVSDDFIARVWATMYEAHWHQFQVLTKRPERMRDLVGSAAFIEAVQIHGQDLAEKRYGDPEEMYVQAGPWPPSNVWLGVSAEHQAAADERIPILLETPAAVRFVSAEPLLGAIRLRPEWLIPWFAADDPRYYAPGGRGVDWLIAGGESGHDARPCHPIWVDRLRRECARYGTAFFFKQWGNWLPVCSTNHEDPWDKHATAQVLDKHCVALEVGGAIVQAENDPERGAWCDYQPDHTGWWLANVGKRTAGRELLGQTWDAMPEVPPAVAEVRRGP